MTYEDICQILTSLGEKELDPSKIRFFLSEIEIKKLSPTSYEIIKDYFTLENIYSVFSETKNINTLFSKVVDKSIAGIALLICAKDMKREQEISTLNLIKLLEFYEHEENDLIRAYNLESVFNQQLDKDTNLEIDFKSLTKGLILYNFVLKSRLIIINALKSRSNDPLAQVALTLHKA